MYVVFTSCYFLIYLLMIQPKSTFHDICLVCRHSRLPGWWTIHSTDPGYYVWIWPVLFTLSAITIPFCV